MSKPTLPSKSETREYKAGDEVESIHGEKLVVESVERIRLKKEGVFTGEVETRILATSGADNKGNPLKCWFPLKFIK